MRPPALARLALLPVLRDAATGLGTPARADPPARALRGREHRRDGDGPARPEAQRRTKELLKRAVPLPGPELIDFTAEAIAKARSSPEGRKGLEAFFAKAPPAWAARVEALRKSSPIKK